MVVSVPCRGLTCFYMICTLKYSHIKMFPSPVGVLHVSIKLESAYGIEGSVSVPCRGLTCFYLNDATFDSGSSVSVPCRGLTCFYGDNKMIATNSMMFPSPVGVLHVSICLLLPQAVVTYPFPSPVGVLHVSIWTFMLMKNMAMSFRPLSGSYMFL